MELTAMAMPRLLVALLLHFLPWKLLSLLLPSTWHPPPDKDASASAPRSLAADSASAGTDPAELTRVFRMFDRDGDGRITKSELADSLENLGIYIADAELAAVIERIDVDGDGCVDADEFAALHRVIMEEEEGQSAGAGEAEMLEAFEVFDQNGDGFITAEELRSVLASLGLRQGRTAEDCRRMISTVDADGNGMVDFKEFKQMMTKGGRLAAVG